MHGGWPNLQPETATANVYMSLVRIAWRCLLCCQITEEWHVADVKSGTFDAAKNVKASCSTEQTAAAVMAPAKDASSVEIKTGDACKHILITGQSPGAPMSHRMGIYNIRPAFYNKRPTYAFHSFHFGTAYLYYENLTPSQRYWVVGSAVGTPDANLGVPSKAETPDKVGRCSGDPHARP